MSTTIRVWAVGEARLPIPGMPGRFVARAPKSHAPLAEGVDVPDDGYHQRAIARGEITATAPVAVKAPTPVAARKEAP